MLEEGKEYYVCIQASNTSGTKDATYSGLTVTCNWTTGGYNTDDPLDNPQDISLGQSISSAVWKNGDKQDYYKFTVTKDGTAAVEISVVNNAGTVLPSTGGIGTTIFYTMGTMLVLGAAVLLITKKRMSVAE